MNIPNPSIKVHLLQNNNTGKSFRHYGNLNFDYKFHFLPELKFVANFGFDRTEGEYISKSTNSVPRSYNTVVFWNIFFISWWDTNSKYCWCKIN